jgi:hypothetical protein
LVFTARWEALDGLQGGNAFSLVSHYTEKRELAADRSLEAGRRRDRCSHPIMPGKAGSEKNWNSGNRAGPKVLHFQIQPIMAQK